MSATLPAPLQLRVDRALGLLRHVAARHAPAVLASSFGAEDMLLIDLVARHRLRAKVWMANS
jgi:phosphoadenosine phosphosulfate reductase